MSFHGGLLGVIAALSLFAWRRGRNAADVFDFTAPLPALGLFFGRIGNFINGELWGKVDHRAVGLQRQRRRCATPRSSTRRRSRGCCCSSCCGGSPRTPRPRLAPSGLFLLVYGLSRFLVEFVRVPDEHIGYLAGGWLTDGPAAVAADDRRWHRHCWRAPTAQRTAVGQLPRRLQ